ncbi:MAG: orange carotenoid protein N-terminal domain-containing protein [Coleofasciculaceae cyanobacterium]
MTFTNLEQNIEQALKDFGNLTVDDQLALLWFVYESMGESITPAAPGAAASEISEGLFNQVKELSHEEQLQVQRNLLSNQNTLISREYGSLSDNSKLLFWYRLAQGMEEGTIVPMPDNYESSQQVKKLLTALETIDFEQQITFLRSAVASTGSAPASGAGV